MNHKAPN